MKAILVDFDTEPGRDFADVRPIGVLLERKPGEGFDSLYLQTVTDDEDDTGHDNYVRTMNATEAFREIWDKGLDAEPIATVEELFTYLATNGYLGLRLRALGKVDDAVTLEEAFDLYVVQAKPLVEMSDEEFPINGT